MRKTLDTARTYIGKRVRIVFDRPLGARHPEHGFRYEVNYGYIPGVFAADGEELDAYFLGSAEPLKETEGVCIAIIHREDDDDDKLVVVPEGIEMTDEAICAAVRFQEHFFRSSVMRR